MITKNKDLMAQACASLSGKWGIAVCLTLVHSLLVGSISIVPILGVVGAWLIAGPLAFGVVTFFLALSRGEEVSIGQLFKGFEGWNRYGTTLATGILVIIFTFLWTLLLIVPGIIASIAYSQTFYILVDNPDISPLDAIKKSKQMMRGYKWKYFCLGLRFMGWILLCILTLGIGFLWLMPYLQTSSAKFYDDLRANPVNEF
jgi:uncharacterized membrane protein